MILTKYGKKEWGMALAAFLVVFVLCAATVFLKILPPGIVGKRTLAVFGRVAEKEPSGKQHETGQCQHAPSWISVNPVDVRI